LSFFFFFFFFYPLNLIRKGQVPKNGYLAGGYHASPTRGIPRRSHLFLSRARKNPNSLIMALLVMSTSPILLAVREGSPSIPMRIFYTAELSKTLIKTISPLASHKAGPDVSAMERLKPHPAFLRVLFHTVESTPSTSAPLRHAFPCAPSPIKPPSYCLRPYPLVLPPLTPVLASGSGFIAGASTGYVFQREYLPSSPSPEPREAADSTYT
jgi:hypothetical protein